MKIQEVIKVGGSLLAEPGAMGRVADWIVATRQEGVARLLVAGGGPVVEGLRTIDAANPLPTEASHWAAVRMMDANTRLLADWLPGVELAESLTGPGRGDVACVVHDWLRGEEPRRSGERLTVGWQTTSDAIAARLAMVLGARLTLLKHTIEPTCGSPAAAAESGIVDPELLRIADELSGCRLIGVIHPGWGA